MRTQITPPTRTLLIDNHDSYTFNLYQLIARVNGEPPTVVTNDDEGCAKVLHDVRNGVYDSVVISPGPGTPHRGGDVGFCPALLEAASDVPVLGVCLGMQLLAAEHGARVTHAPAPVHGRLSSIQHTGHALFHNIPSGPKGGFDVVRYHSLAVVEESLPSYLQPIAWTCGSHHAVSQPASTPEPQPHRPYPGNSNGFDTPSERVLMAIAHADRPHYGVQFHPESIATAFGHVVIENFRQLTQQHRKTQSRRLAVPALPSDGNGHDARRQQKQTQLDVAFRCLPENLSSLGGSENLFGCLYGSTGAADTFWLDSSDQKRGRFSYMGGRGGPLWQRITYRISTGSASVPQRAGGGAGSPHGVVSTENAAGHMNEEAVSSFFCWLERRLGQLTCSQLSSAAAELPFDFCGGFVGYLGYELKSECGFASSHSADTPDAAMFLADRFVVIDHQKGDVYLLALHESKSAAGEADAQMWLEASSRAASAAARVQQSAQSATNGCSANGHSHPARDLSSRSHGHTKPQTRAAGTGLCFSARRSRAEYVQDVQSCLQALYDGESYELCLTTMLTAKQQVEALSLYRTLRRMNPAPYAAWLSFGDEVQVCCSSPERFLRGGRGKTVEAKPIKGTARRILKDAVADAAAAAALEASEKDRAENLMIVDLLRNDLGRICQVGTVHVPALMQVESFATVHQLVSTDASIVDCLRATFPGGSMTGAPKQRSVAILDKLEGAARGIYSGVLGFIAFNDTFDFNIVIRTAVVHKGCVNIGAGGAIVVQSDPEDEYEEMELKAAALIRATQAAANLGTA